MRVLKAHVHVTHEGKNVVLEPGQVIPDWASAQVTNPKAFDEVDDPKPGTGDRAEVHPLQLGGMTHQELFARYQELQAALAERQAPPDPVVEDEPPHPPPADDLPKGNPPPRAGAGSSRDAWAEYAEAHGIAVDADMSRDAIQAALQTAGVPIG